MHVIDSPQCLQDQERLWDQERWWCSSLGIGTCCTSKCNGFHKGIVVGLKYRDPNAPLHSCVAEPGDTGHFRVCRIIEVRPFGTGFFSMILRHNGNVKPIFCVEKMKTHVMIVLAT